MEELIQSNEKKLHISITKLVSTDINSYQAVVYYNVHMIKSAYFRYIAVKLSKSQEYELKRLYKESLLIKLELIVLLSFKR